MLNWLIYLHLCTQTTKRITLGHELYVKINSIHISFIANAPFSDRSKSNVQVYCLRNTERKVNYSCKIGSVFSKIILRCLPLFSNQSSCQNQNMNTAIKLVLAVLLSTSVKLKYCELQDCVLYQWGAAQPSAGVSTQFLKGLE